MVFGPQDSKRIRGLENKREQGRITQRHPRDIKNPFKLHGKIFN